MDYLAFLLDYLFNQVDGRSILNSLIGAILFAVLLWTRKKFPKIKAVATFVVSSFSKRMAAFMAEENIKSLRRYKELADDERLYLAVHVSQSTWFTIFGVTLVVNFAAWVALSVLGDYFRALIQSDGVPAHIQNSFDTGLAVLFLGMLVSVAGMLLVSKRAQSSRQQSDDIDRRKLTIYSLLEMSGLDESEIASRMEEFGGPPAQRHSMEDAINSDDVDTAVSETHNTSGAVGEDSLETLNQSISRIIAKLKGVLE